MGHGLETDDNMFSVREVPWHGLGTILQDAPDSEQALLMAGLAWGVEKRQIRLVGGAEISEYFATTRVTDNKVLGVVGKRYNILQNKEAFSFTDALLGEGARYETAGSLFGGKQVWMLARMPEVYKVAEDTVQTFILVTNRHDGFGAVTAAVVPVRAVCKNTINLALRQAHRQWKTKHTGSMTTKVDEAKRTLQLTRNYMAELGNLADILCNISLTSDTWGEMVSELIPLPKDPERLSTIDRIKDRQNILRNRIYAPDLANIRWTAWGAVNAVADFADHALPLRETKTWQEHRFVDVTSGHAMVDQAVGMLMRRV